MAIINSDDPSYLGGYMNDNYLAVTNVLNLNPNGDASEWTFLAS